MTQNIHPKQSTAGSSSLFATDSRNELIPIIHKNNEQLVDARQLHEFMKIGKHFTTWIKDRIVEFGFKEGLDFFPNLGKTQSNFGRPTNDYLITLDMAKELAMIERNPQGRQIRQYFIACEKKLRQPHPHPLPNGEGGVALKKLDKHIKPIKINGRKLYDYRKVQTLLGFCTKTSTNTVRKRFDGQIVIFDQKSYVSEEYVAVMISRANTRSLERYARVAAPVLPIGFGTLNLQ